MNIIIFGDRIVWGASDTEHGGWVERLKIYCLSQELSVDKDVDVYNLGVSGDNTEDLLKRFEIELLARLSENKTIIIFAIGTNDSQIVLSQELNRITIDTFSDNVVSLINISKKYSDNIIFLSPLIVDESKTVPIPWNTDKKYLNEELSRYKQILEYVCDKKEVTMVDLQSVLTVNDLDDGLHPNSSGHKKIFEEIRNLLKL